jgi:hypothetical protein
MNLMSFVTVDEPMRSHARLSYSTTRQIESAGDGRSERFLSLTKKIVSGRMIASDLHIEQPSRVVVWRYQALRRVPKIPVRAAGSVRLLPLKLPGGS